MFVLQPIGIFRQVGCYFPQDHITSPYIKTANGKDSRKLYVFSIKSSYKKLFKTTKRKNLIYRKHSTSFKSQKSFAISSIISSSSLIRSKYSFKTSVGTYLSKSVNILYSLPLYTRGGISSP